MILLYGLSCLSCGSQLQIKECDDGWQLRQRVLGGRDWCMHGKLCLAAVLECSGGYHALIYMPMIKEAAK